MGSVDSDHLRGLGEFYGSLTINLLSLFLAITGGIDWVDIMAPLKLLPWTYTAVFMLFISFLTFGVLNLVTGIFVDSALSLSQNDKRDVIRNQVRQQDTWARQIQDIFSEADQDHSGTLSWDEFRDHIEHPVIKAYFATLELDFSEARGLFALLDTHDNGQIEIQAFVQGCQMLRGEAKSIDLATLRYETKKLLDSLLERVDNLTGLVLSEGGSSESLHALAPERFVSSDASEFAEVSRATGDADFIISADSMHQSTPRGILRGVLPRNAYTDIL